MSNRLIFTAIIAASIGGLTSCAYVLDKQIQDITVLTPGATNTVCYVYVDDLRYRVHPPQTINISKSYKDLIVDCLAPGNRRRKVVIEPVMSEHVPLNAANGVIPGTSWDLASNAFFAYPEIITVDFTGAPTAPEPMPAQNDPDIKQPEEYLLEEFSPNLPRLNSDRNSMPYELQRRQKAEGVSGPVYVEGGIAPDASGHPSDKGDLKSVVDGLTTSTPTSPTAGQPVSKPIAPPVGSIEPYPVAPRATVPAYTAPNLMTDPAPKALIPADPAASGPPTPLSPAQ